jgi:hypothetical protein
MHTGRAAPRRLARRGSCRTRGGRVAASVWQLITDPVVVGSRPALVGASTAQVMLAPPSDATCGGETTADQEARADAVAEKVSKKAIIRPFDATFDVTYQAKKVVDATSQTSPCGSLPDFPRSVRATLRPSN